MISRATFLGGSEELALDSDKSLKHTARRVQVVTPDVNDRKLYLPDARLLPVGWILYIVNNHAAHNIKVKKSGSEAFFWDLPGNNSLALALIQKSTQAGLWRKDQGEHY